MIDPEREELLSAYLDGEVSPEERARVERWLADSGELRQLQDELLAMRGDLQALPRHPVGHDLAAVVIHRSMVGAAPDPSSRSASTGTDTKGTGTTGAAADRESPLGNIIAEWWNRGSQGRRFLWPALAVAAALAILVFDARQRPDEFQVAQAPEAAPAEFSEDELKESSPEAMSSAEQPSIGAAPEMNRAAPEMSASEPHPSSALDSAASAPAQSPMPAGSAAPQGGSSGRLQRNFGSLRKSAPADPGAGAPGPMNAPASEAESASSFFAKRGEESALSSAVQTIVCPVTAQYLEGREFEKLLDANKVRWRSVPIPQQLQIQAAPPSPRTAPLESLGKSPLQSLYFLQVKGEQANAILSQVPQADRLMEGNRMAISVPQQQQNTTANGAPSGVQVMLVAPVDATAPRVPTAK